jgi:hypothetical protein
VPARLKIQKKCAIVNSVVMQTARSVLPKPDFSSAMKKTTTLGFQLVKGQLMREKEGKYASFATENSS